MNLRFPPVFWAGDTLNVSMYIIWILLSHTPPGFLPTNEIQVFVEVDKSSSGGGGLIYLGIPGKWGHQPPIYPNHRDVSWKTKFVYVVSLGFRESSPGSKNHDFALVGEMLTFLQAQFLDHKTANIFVRRILCSALSPEGSNHLSENGFMEPKYFIILCVSEVIPQSSSDKVIGSLGSWLCRWYQRIYTGSVFASRAVGGAAWLEKFRGNVLHNS